MRRERPGDAGITRWWRLASPPGVLELVATLVPRLSAGAIAAGALGLALGFLIVPTDPRQGDLFRIVYIHVPAAVAALVCFALVVLAAGTGLFARAPGASMVAAAIAPTGAMFALLALWTGSLWGKPLTGRWWDADIRLAVDLALLALFVAMIVIHTAVEDVVLADRGTAVVAILGSVVIVVLFAAGALLSAGGADAAARPPDVEQLPPLALLGVALVGCGCLCYGAAAVLMRLRCEVLERARDSDWVTLQGAVPR